MRPQSSKNYMHLEERKKEKWIEQWMEKWMDTFYQESKHLSRSPFIHPSKDIGFHLIL